MSFVTLEHRGPVGLITMNRPEALNALNDQVLRDLDAVLDQVEADDSILVAVITGAGRSFVAGADIGQMSTLTAAEAKAFGVLGNRVFSFEKLIGSELRDNVKNAELLEEMEEDMKERECEIAEQYESDIEIP